MHTPPQDDALLKKCRKRSEVIAAFLYEYGEQATWEDWRTFLHERQAKGFEWTNSLD